MEGHQSWWSGLCLVGPKMNDLTTDCLGTLTHMLKECSSWVGNQANVQSQPLSSCCFAARLLGIKLGQKYIHLCHWIDVNRSIPTQPS